MFKTIIWATDGSEGADRALPYVKELASKFGGNVVAVHSEEFLMGPRAGGEPVHADEDEVKAKIQRQVADLVEDGIDASSKLVGGSSLLGAAHMIADAAVEAGADVIVVGTRGHTPLAGLIVGGVTQRLLHIAPCPVIAVPPIREREATADEPAAAARA